MAAILIKLMSAPQHDSRDTIAIIDNQGSEKHESRICQILAGADEIYISVAFMKKHALQCLLPSLQSALKAGASATIIIGGDFYLTEPEALKALHTLCRSYHPKAHAYLVQPAKETFHPKVYCAVRGNGVTMVVGSANLTDGGLNSNFELSLLHSTDTGSSTFQAFRNWLFATQAAKRVTELDELCIGAYEVRHDIYKRVTRQAERRAQAEIKQQYTLDATLLHHYVKEYKADKEERLSWADKQNNYRQAKEVLESMINTPPTTRADFLTSYGDLVGAAHSRKLWHSGSIFRAKNDVADHYPKFLAMLLAVRTAIGRPAEDIFELGMSHAGKIHGLGPNVLTEIMNTYAPSLYSVLNKNPIGSFRQLGIAKYPDPGSFRPETYVQYNNLMKQLATRCGFKDLSEVDHFTNYVYWKHVKGSSPSVSRDGL